jgi:hypothetical protein
MNMGQVGQVGTAVAGRLEMRLKSTACSRLTHGVVVR